MFERFSDEARQVVVLAQEEAREFRHGYIGTEHILLGLLRGEEQRPEEARPLGALRITLAEARERVARLVGSGEEPSGGQIPFTPRAKKVLELSLREALSLGHDWIDPEHILLGLARENEGVASRVFLEFDADPERIRSAVLRVVADMPRRPRAQVMRGVPWRRLPMEPAWFDGLDDVLVTLAREIRRALAREPDLGDLLLTIACARRTLAGEALRELGIELDALWATVERIRETRSERSGELERRINEVRDQKRQALQDERFQEAARLRDEERQLTEERQLIEQGYSQSQRDVLEEARGRLGLPTPDE
jgi:ATP-dependent Clp protease ATP-binding subunit ClpA